MQPNRKAELGAHMPASPIYDQEYLFVWTCAYRCGKGVQRHLESLHRDGGQQQPEGVASTGADKAVQIGPLVARTHYRQRTLAFGAPDAAQDGLEADAMFILGPDLDRGLRVGSLRCLGQER